MSTSKNTSKLKKVIIILGIIILPLLYSFIYLKGFWDPYGKLENVPIALVNNDKCEENCKGDELVRKLKDNGTFKFEEVDEDTADDGLINKDYYAIITIPEDFTESFETAETKDRRRATLTYSPNQKTNYLASQIISSAMTKVQEELNSEVSKEVVTTLNEKFNEVPEQTRQIETALGTIGDGTATLNSGAQALKSGSQTLNTSYKAFDGGINELTSGLNTLVQNYTTLNDGISDLYNEVHGELIPSVTSSLTDLQSGVADLKAGSNALTMALNSYDYKNSMTNFIMQTESVYKALSAMCQMPNSGIDSSICAVASGYTTVNPETNTSGIEGLKTLTTKLIDSESNINTGINTLASNLSGVGTLSAGLTDLDNALLKLNNGSKAIFEGITTLETGAEKLSSNSKSVAEGINKIDTSLQTLSNGTETLNNGVNEAKTEVSKKISETESELESLDGLADYAKEPVEIKEDAYGNVESYGVFFSPYFMCLSLWVGGILILMGLYYDPDGRFKVLGRNSENRTKRLIYYNIIGVIQAVLLATILKVFMGFEVTNIFLYYGSCILISISFLSIILFLFFNFKDVGKFLSLVLLILQLASCGGTFPVETEPTFYQAIYHFIPMTYAVDLLRESFVSINSSFLVKDVIILLVILIVFATLTFITGKMKSKKEVEVISAKKTVKKLKKA